MENGKIVGVRTPKPLNQLTKFDVGDYVADITPQAKNQSDIPNGGVQAAQQIGVILLSRGL